MCKTLTMKEWQSRGEELFGKDKKNWKFKCVNCGEVQSYHDFKEAGVENPENYVYFSCIGRFVKSRGCDWTLGGLSLSTYRLLALMLTFGAFTLPVIKKQLLNIAPSAEVA